MKIILATLLIVSSLWLSSCASNNCFGPIPQSVQTGHDQFTAALAKP